jgi:fucose permease
MFPLGVYNYDKNHKNCNFNATYSTILVTVWGIKKALYRPMIKRFLHTLNLTRIKLTQVKHKKEFLLQLLLKSPGEGFS